MNTITKTRLVTDVDVAGATLHRVPTTRWMLSTGESTAHIDLVSCTAITDIKGDRRDVATLLAYLTGMSLDLDINEDDQRLEWLAGYNDRVWAVPAGTIFDHCDAALAAYRTPHPVA